MHDARPPCGRAPRCLMWRRLLQCGKRSLLAALAVSAIGTAEFAAVRGDDLAKARRLLRSGSYAEALELFQAEQAGASAAALLGAAECRLAQGQLVEAEALLGEGARRFPNVAAFPARLAHQALLRGDHAAAQRLAQGALDVDEQHLLARWVTAELHRTSGRLREAGNAYQWFVDYYNRTPQITDSEALRWIGLAAAEYARWTRNSGQFRFLVSRLYPAALRLEADYWPAHVEAALLFLEKYNQADAAAELAAALAINPQAAEAHAVRAMLALQQYDLETAAVALDRARQINPGLLLAHQLQADLLLADFRTVEAIGVLENALALNPRSEATLGRLAAACGAADGLADRSPATRMGSLIEQAVERNPRCGEFFLTLASTLDLLRKYPQAAEYYEEAARRMPQLLAPKGRLGMLRMRLGEEEAARRLLQTAIEIDPFNVRVKNSLAVLEVLDEYETLETEHFLIRFDPRHDRLLARFAARYLEEEVYPDLCRRMGFEPPAKTLIEIFHHARQSSGHAWFSARMVGLPYVGTVGACAGKMIGMVSPGATDRPFHWARVLRHEFVHILNLQQTDFHIPHWFTEALAVYHEDKPYPREWRRILARRVREGPLFDLGTINHGFVRPNDSDDWALAYFQAVLYAEYMIERFGASAHARLLDAYAKNLATDEAIRAAFAVTIEDFEAGYRRFVQQTAEEARLPESFAARDFAALQQAAARQPDDPGLLAQLAQACLARGLTAPARQYAEAARAIEPLEPGASYVLARLHLAAEDAEAAVRLLAACLDEAALGDRLPDAQALALLADLRLAQRQYDEAARLYAWGEQCFPYGEEWTKSLARVYLRLGDEERLAPVLERLAAHEPDNPLIRKKRAEIALGREDFAAARHWALDALYIDVRDAETHAMLARAAAGQGRGAEAIEAYAAAIELAPRQLAWRRELVRLHLDGGDREQARAVLDTLLALEPDDPQARQLQELLDP